MSSAEKSSGVTSIVDFVKGLPEYQRAPKGDKLEVHEGKTKGTYGQNRRSPVHTLNSTVLVRINRTMGQESIELPAGSEVYIYRKFAESTARGSRQAADSSVATVFFPRGEGQVTVTVSERSILKVFSSRK